ncbi:hypothetical protein BN389_04000 [Listeria monocytogenes serotype 4b str. LL195]|nr:hypothetical protein BN389_04000 [Listeria monocytogenes serotype 4b str. LL195]
MIAFWNDNRILMLHSHRFIKRPVIRIDTLKNKTLLRINFMIITFFQKRLRWQIIAVMFMRRITRKISAIRIHFHNQQTARNLTYIWQNVMYQSFILIFSALLNRIITSLNKCRWQVSIRLGVAKRYTSFFCVRLHLKRPSARNKHAICRNFFKDIRSCPNLRKNIVTLTHCNFPSKRNNTTL